MPNHFKYTVPSANIPINLNTSASGLWIKPHQFKNIHLTTCAFVWRGRLAYAAIRDKSDCFGSMLLFFFVEPIHRWNTQGFNFFNFERILYWWNKGIFKLLFSLTVTLLIYVNTVLKIALYPTVCRLHKFDRTKGRGKSVGGLKVGTKGNFSPKRKPETEQN